MKALNAYGTCVLIGYVLVYVLAAEPTTQAPEANVSVYGGGSGCVPQEDFLPDGRVVLVEI